MKPINTLFLFAFLILLAGCFNAPDFNDSPRIEFKDLCFGIAADPQKSDSLVLEIDFEDGDGDLGLNQSFRNEPYHEYDLFLSDDMSIGPAVRTFYPDDTSPGYLVVPANSTGKLIRAGDPIVGLPPNTCVNFKTLTVNVRAADRHIFDESYEYTAIPNETSPIYYRVMATFYVEPNEKSRNIFVKFYHKETDSSPLEEYNGWCVDFDGRFMVLSDKKSAISGSLKYTMIADDIDWLSTMSTGQWQVRVSVMDRAFHKSNEVSTPLFTLDQIVCQ